MIMLLISLIKQFGLPLSMGFPQTVGDLNRRRPGSAGELSERPPVFLIALKTDNGGPYLKTRTLLSLPNKSWGNGLRIIQVLQWFAPPFCCSV
jgi:hypothetical protein